METAATIRGPRMVYFEDGLYKDCVVLHNVCIMHSSSTVSRGLSQFKDEKYCCLFDINKKKITGKVQGSERVR